MLNPTLDDIQRALELPGFDHEQAWRLMAPRPRVLRRSPNLPGAARDAAVLLLLYPRDGELTFVLTRRTDSVGTHKGQISLPGGAVEPDDDGPVAAALRETCEELAVCDENIRLLGELTPLYVVVSDFVIHPIVGYLPAHPQFVPQPSEVAEVIEVRLADLLDEQVKVEERWTLSGVEVDVPYYRLNGHIIWGATAIILSEFENRLRVAARTDPA